MPLTHSADFDYNSLKLGTTVEVSLEPNFRNRYFGLVTRAKNNGADIRVLHPEGGELMLFDCWHHTDTRVKDRSEVFDTQDKGVFGLSATEKAIRSLQENLPFLKQLAETPELVQGLSARIAKMEKLFDAPPEQKKRGAPRSAKEAMGNLEKDTVSAS